MGCNKSKDKDVIIQTGGHTKNRDQGLRKRNIVSDSSAKNGQGEKMKTAMKKKTTTTPGTKIEKHVTFEKQEGKEPIPENEKLIAIDEIESEDENFYSADEEINAEKEKQFQKEPGWTDHPTKI